MFKHNNVTIPLDTPFTIDGTSYPANWLRLTSLAEKQAVGITEVADVTTTYDDRFYWGVGNPKQLNDETITPEHGDSYVQKGLKSQWVAQINDTAWKLLTPTDYMDSRKTHDETYVAPQVWLDWRATIRTQAKTAKTAIQAVTTVEELISAIQVNWAEAP